MIYITTSGIVAESMTIGNDISEEMSELFFQCLLHGVVLVVMHGDMVFKVIFHPGLPDPSEPLSCLHGSGEK